jgi:hypothetical protein
MQKLGKMSREAYIAQAVEILGALKKLGEELSASEAAFLAENMNAAMAAFDKTSNQLGSFPRASLFASLRSDVQVHKHHRICFRTLQRKCSARATEVKKIQNNEKRKIATRFYSQST